MGHMAKVVALISLCLVFLATVRAQITENLYYVPGYPYTYPQGIVAGPDGALWFADGANYSAYIGRITMEGDVEQWAIPYEGNFPNPYSIATGPDGALWFTDQGTNSIGRACASISPPSCLATGDIVEYPIPTPSSGPGAIKAGADGNLWFVENAANKIGRVCVSTSQPSCLFVGHIDEFDIPTPNSNANGITAGLDGEGTMWFAETGVSNIGRICTTVTPSAGCPKVGSTIEYPTKTPNSYPFDITTGPDNAMWFTEEIGQIGRITRSGQMTEYAANRGYDQPSFIATGPDGALWFVDYYASYYSSLGRMTPDGSFPVYYSIYSWPQQLTSGPDGALWVAEYYGWIVQAIPPSRRNGVDLSASAGVPSPSQLVQFSEAGIQYAVIKAPQYGQTGQNEIDIARKQLDEFSGAGFGTAAYCFLHFTQWAQSGTQQAENCLETIGPRLGSLKFIAVDVEDEHRRPLAPPARRLQILQDALNTLAAAGAKMVIYTNSGDWAFLLTRYTKLFTAYPLWTGATWSFEEYVDPGGNLPCGFGYQSLMPARHGGDGIPSLTPFTAFGSWTTQLGHQYDIGNGPWYSTCLFGARVDFDVFDPSLFQ